MSGTDTESALHLSKVSQLLSSPAISCLHRYLFFRIRPLILLASRSRCFICVEFMIHSLINPQFYDDICEMLVTAGYFRARISTLPPFDKILGGLTWC
jgi:hypothetical protein